MKINWILIGLLSVGAVLPSVARSDEDTSSVTFLPNAHELFLPLRADPRELQYALRPGVPVGHKLYGDIAIGDYIGFVRWAVPSSDLKLQVSFGGGVFGRFDLSGTRDNMQSDDFYANLPIDFRYHGWSDRLLFYHTSSHLGDDYIAQANDDADVKHSWDNVGDLISHEWTHLRLYGGYNYAARTFPEHLGRQELQGGLESQTSWMNSGHTQWYWANDFQSWQRIRWNPIFTTQAGIKYRAKADTDRALSLFIEYGAGHQSEGQFFLQEESHWELGLKFDLT